MEKGGWRERYFFFGGGGGGRGWTPLFGGGRAQFSVRVES